MECIVCHKGYGEDHRWCLVELFKNNKIKSVKEWEDASKALAKPKRRIRALVPLE